MLILELSSLSNNVKNPKIIDSGQNISLNTFNMVSIMQILQFNLKGQGHLQFHNSQIKINTQIKKNETKFGPLPFRNLQVTFNKPNERQLLESKTETQYVTAGHPLLEAVIDLSLKDGQNNMRIRNRLFGSIARFSLEFCGLSKLHLQTDRLLSKKYNVEVSVLFTPFSDESPFELK